MTWVRSPDCPYLLSSLGIVVGDERSKKLLAQREV
jgi:hypothetical protein